uniref:Aspartate aminotransferase n=1 Tax=Lygus hesperus TaxID=30085 RepID=A0A0A9WPU0_LYGHE
MNMDYEYLPISGYQPFIDEALKLIYTPNIYDRVVGIQTLSGTGALSVGAMFLSKLYDKETTHVYLSDPTWVNHRSIFEQAGWKNINTYSYYDPKTIGFNLNAMKASVVGAPKGSIFVLHECAHNPTGVDPTHDEWLTIAELMLRKGHQVFFDSAYQGYASGSLDDDAYAARIFAEKGIEYLCAQSFSKNLGLYNERIGTLSVVLNDPSHKNAVLSQLKHVARSCYSNPPAHGARLVHIILSDP